MRRSKSGGAFRKQFIFNQATNSLMNLRLTRIMNAMRHLIEFESKNHVNCMWGVRSVRHCVVNSHICLLIILTHSKHSGLECITQCLADQASSHYLRYAFCIFCSFGFNLHDLPKWIIAHPSISVEIKSASTTLRSLLRNAEWFTLNKFHTIKPFLPHGFCT